MKTRLFVVLILVIGLLAALSSAAAAQAPSGDGRSGFAPELTGPNVEPEPPFNPEGTRPWGNPVAGSTPQPSVAPDGIPIGQPGLSFRYDRTYGFSGTPYFEDSSHLNHPGAVTVNGTSIWISERFGSRAMKFTSGGAFVTQIGKAGLRDVYPHSLDEADDVAVDASGNIWIVDWGASHVLKFDSSLKYVSELGQGWNRGQDNIRFDYPAAIAFDATGRIYVSDGAPEWSPDSGNHRIQVFDSSGAYLTTIGVTGQAGTGYDHFHGPRQITISGDLLYIADSGNHRVQILNIANPAAPIYVATIGVTGQSGNDDAHLSSPSGVALDANYIYVADTGNNRVQIFERTTRNHIATLGGTWGAGNSQFKTPTDVAVDAAGNIYVADAENHRVQQFNIARTYARTYGTTGVPYLTDRTHFYQPNGAALGPDGSLYVTENRGHRLLKLSADGTPQWSIGEAGVYGGWNGENDHFNWPQDVAVDAAGRAFVADQWNDRIQVFNPDGSYVRTLGQWGTGNDQFKCPRGVGFASNGDVYVADTCNHRVQIFNASLAYVATLGVTGVAGSDNAHFRSPNDVAVDHDGVIYVAERDNNRVQVFGPDRVYRRTIGLTGQGGNNHGYFNAANKLAVDASGRLYVADGWNGRVQVYDSTGAYLTTIGGNGSSRPDQIGDAWGIAVSPDGSQVYVPDYSDNSRIQRYVPGVPGWRQVNINGFGDRNAGWLSSLLPFQGSLYAAGYPARVWRMTAAGVWSQANPLGFGDNTNTEIDALAEFNGQLYAPTSTWVCDDANCSTGHTDGPQIWRTADGTTWQNATPSGGIGSGDRYVASLVVFNGQLYAGLSGNATHGAEIWRTADGLAWTRVVENGFADGMYDYVALSMAVYNGNLYAGTGHGDWFDDGHPDGPLGGEVWRSGDGSTWVQVNAPGFGNLEAHRVESLHIFQNGLYAYVSHANGTAAGADVWRCTKAVCAEQGDWTQVVTNGFGVPQNQYLYAGAVSGGYLYAAAYNATTGMQLWRTANGSQWEKATPYDGLGNSNNRYVYTGAMTVFNGRLTLGITNGASGVGVWQNTLTADFTATPTRGAPPLTVQFTNTSAGDFTTSQWDFGDGAMSTETNPTHTYTVPGTYAVTLTVGDGTETSAITKPAYIVAKYFTYLPLVMKNYDPLRYDDFNDATWDGSWNPALWNLWSGSGFQVRQENGAMVFSNPAPIRGSRDLALLRPGNRSLRELQMFEARLKLSSNRAGGVAAIWLQFAADNGLAGHDGWGTHCGLGGSSAQQWAQVYCNIMYQEGNTYYTEYSTPAVQVNYDTWYTVRIETDPTTANMRFFLGDTLLGSHVPSDAAALLASNAFQPRLSALNFDSDVTCTRYVDDVRITPAQ